MRLATVLRSHFLLSNRGAEGLGAESLSTGSSHGLHMLVYYGGYIVLGYGAAYTQSVKGLTF